MKDKERFSSTELTALRNDLIQGGLADSREAAELLQISYKNLIAKLKEHAIE